MLRKTLKRTGDDLPKRSAEKRSEQTDTTQESSPEKFSRHVTDLEGIVLGDSKDLIQEIDRSFSKKKTKKKRILFKTKKTSAWVDGYEKEKQSDKESITPAWASLQRKNDDELDKDTRELLQTTGDYLVQASSLPAGVLDVKRLGDANADDTYVGKIQNVEFHPSAKVILTAGTSHRLSLFQIDGRHNPKIQSIFFEDYPIHTAHFSRCGEEIIVGSDRKNFMVYNMIAGKVMNIPKIKRLEGSNMTRFETSPDGKYLAFLGQYGAIHLISAQGKEWVDTLTMNGDVHSLAFSDDGSKIFSFGDSGTVFVWDMKTRSCVHTFIDEGCVKGTSIAVSPNNQYIACGSQSGIVNIYDQNTCLQKQTPKPLRAVTNLVTVCNKTKFNCTSEILGIASSEQPKALKMVHFPSMHVFANFPELTDKFLQIPKCLDFSPKSGYMAVGNHRGHALLYRLNHFDSF